MVDSQVMINSCLGQPAVYIVSLILFARGKSIVHDIPHVLVLQDNVTNEKVPANINKDK